MTPCQGHTGGGAIVLHINLVVTRESSLYKPYCVFPRIMLYFHSFIGFKNVIRAKLFVKRSFFTVSIVFVK